MSQIRENAGNDSVDANNLKPMDETADSKREAAEKSTEKKSEDAPKTPKSTGGSSKSKRQRLSIKKSIRGSIPKEMKTTMLTFQAVMTKPTLARVQLLLCNISDRDIFVKLRCNANSNVSALPASSGHISPKSQMRICLNWKMPEGVSNWKDVAMPKILLTTYFLQKGQQSADESPTNTRLLARVSTSKQCDADNLPIEQLLLDAVGKDGGSSADAVTSPNPTQPMSPEKVEDEDMKWIIYLLVFLIIVLLLNNNNKN